MNKRLRIMTHYDYTSLIGETSIIKNSVHRQAENLPASPFRPNSETLWLNCGRTIVSDVVLSVLRLPLTPL